MKGLRVASGKIYGNQEPTELSGLSEANGYQEKGGNLRKWGVWVFWIDC